VFDLKKGKKSRKRSQKTKRGQTNDRKAFFFFKRSYILLLRLITCTNDHPHYNIPANCSPPYTFNFPSTEIISLLHFYIQKNCFQKELKIEKKDLVASRRLKNCSKTGAKKIKKLKLKFGGPKNFPPVFLVTSLSGQLCFF
jgi:hypothetical protein